MVVSGAACSDGLRDAARTDSERGASGVDTWNDPAGCATPDAERRPDVSVYAMHGARGYPYCNIDLDEWCRPADYKNLSNISFCFELTNRTRKFTAPDILGSRFPLTLSQAYCNSYRDAGDAEKGYLDDKGLCREMSGYRGNPRVYGLGSAFPNQARLLNPNPFMETGAIQFAPSVILAGLSNRLFVNSSMAPFTTGQPGAEPYGYSPYNIGSNAGDCDTQGRYLWCRLTSPVTPKTYDTRASFEIGNYPLRLQIKNSSGRPMKLRSSSAGTGFLVDPVAVGSVEDLPAGGTAYIGGYLVANTSEAAMSWTGSYCIETIAGTCVDVEVTFQLKFTVDKDAVDPKARNYTNTSTCLIDNRSATTTYKCNTPSFNNSVESPVLTANVTSF